MKKVNETFTAKQANVTSAASKIVPEAARDTVMIRNIGSNTVYVGGSNVTSSTGFPINAGEALTLESTIDVYAITASGTSVVAILEER
ncbi:hypothetical protein JQ617_08080 [Bradyrhizobium sp. KB893862 SZCCT0404]|uniref:hypothetical protein n=1 Tax=Bradyrhizobium sp. KB893862 SZCCT0404 TaxID=2807672 RepID=UPI001BADA900|nr:hypothetical protein [Bradyrhizobium sp. KB893862 SZCCT0404]MBR1173908.1 hypothetical protein [Bradyrhizobium sp. KB893862 SZCCT0404]